MSNGVGHFYVLPFWTLIKKSKIKKIKMTKTKKSKILKKLKLEAIDMWLEFSDLLAKNERKNLVKRVVLQVQLARKINRIRKLQETQKADL